MRVISREISPMDSKGQFICMGILRELNDVYICFIDRYTGKTYIEKCDVNVYNGASFVGHLQQIEDDEEWRTAVCMANDADLFSEDRINLALAGRIF